MIQVTGKLSGHTAYVDIYLASGHPLAAAYRNSVAEMKDTIHGLAHSYDKKASLTIAIRIMIWYQNEMFTAFRKLRDGAPDETAYPRENCPKPSFDALTHALETANFNLLPTIPEAWMEQVRDDAPELALTRAEPGYRPPCREPAEKKRKVVTYQTYRSVGAQDDFLNGEEVARFWNFRRVHSQVQQHGLLPYLGTQGGM